MTALHWSVREGRTAVTDQLLVAGAMRSVHVIMWSAFLEFQYYSVTQPSTDPQSANELVYSASSNSSLPLYPWNN